MKISSFLNDASQKINKELDECDNRLTEIRKQIEINESKTKNCSRYELANLIKASNLLISENILIIERQSDLITYYTNIATIMRGDYKNINKDEFTSDIKKYIQ